MPDQDQTIEFSIRVRSYGPEDVVRRSVELSMCRAMHNTFGIDRAQIIAMPTGDELHFDPLGDDGHHEGHSAAITRTPGSRFNARGPLAAQADALFTSGLVEDPTRRS